MGDAVIYGEVQNTSSVGADFVKVNATIKDSSGVILDVDYTYVNPSTVPAGKTYQFTMYTDAPYADTADIAMSVNYNGTSSDTPEAGLTLSNLNFVNNGLGDVKILGEITNTSSSLKEYCKVNAIFYDSAGKVLYCDSTYTDPSSIGSGYTNSFEMYTDMPVAGYSTYKLYAISSSNY